MPTILVSGAASGLGLAFVTAYAHDTSNTIIAIDKNPHNDRISTASTSYHIVDVTSPTSIDEFAAAIAGTAIDLVVHSAGVRGLVPALVDAHPDNAAACETLDGMDLDTLVRTFHVNAAGTFFLLRALLPSLRLAQDPKVVVMSSRMGSVGQNVAGGGYAYRASKAALNTMVRSLCSDVPEVVFVLCHPGRVETGLVKYREEGAIGADESVRDLLPLINGWGREDTGKFYDRYGKEIQW
ncbi:hypothetical protein MMC19_004874 [Ptychographa xylographoides]|nr:hypothetical protein [Ptychographa xylographoides]